MKKDERLQIRVTAEEASFLKDYSTSKKITISQMVRDFIRWLMQKEQETEDGSQGKA